MEFKKALETLSDSKLSRVFMLNSTAYVEGTGKRIKIDGDIPFEGTINTQAIWYATMVYPEAKRTIEAACLKVSEEREKLKVEMKINVHSLEMEKEEPEYFAVIDIEAMRRAYERIVPILDEHEREIIFQHRFGRLFMLAYNRKLECLGAEAIGHDRFETCVLASTISKVLNTFTTGKVYAGLSKRMAWFSDGGDIEVYGARFSTNVPVWETLLDEDAMCIMEVDAAELMRILLLCNKLSNFCILNFKDGVLEIEVTGKDSLKATLRGRGIGEGRIAVRNLPLAYVLKGQGEISLEMIREDLLLLRGYYGYYMFKA